MKAAASTNSVRTAERSDPLLLSLLRHFEGRQTEVLTTLVLISLSIHLSLWPQSVANSSFNHLLNYIQPNLLSFFFGLFGFLRFAALIANGTWPKYGPYLRAAGAFAGALIFANMSAALYQNVLSNGTQPSPGIPVYIILSLFELLSIYRALVTMDKRKWLK